MCNTYQALSGIYIVMVLALIFKDLISGNEFLVNRGDIVKTASIKEIPSTIKKNIILWLKSIYSDSSRIWIILFIFIILTFIISYIFKTKVNFIKSALYVFLYLILGTILSFGVYLIFSHDLTGLRNYYGFGAFLGITLVLLSEKKTIKSLNLIKNILICTFMYYILYFNFTYSLMLSYQKDAFEVQSIILASDLKNIVDHKKGNVFANKLFKDSPVFISSALNYPILYKLIDSNSVIYWPNNMRLNAYSGLNLNINFFDFSKFDASNKTLEVSNYYYDIFTENDEIYIFMK